MGRYVSTLTFDHNENFSCVFRNWKSPDPTNHFLHGCILSVKIVFESFMLDENNQNINDSLNTELRQYLKNHFSYTTFVSEDDPAIGLYRLLSSQKIIKLRIMPQVGLEQFAEKIFNDVKNILATNKLERLTIKTVELREHSGASSLYIE